MVVEQVELESEASEMESAGTEAAEAIAAEAQASEEAAAAVEPTDVPDETETTEQAVEAARPKGPEPEPVELEIVEAEAEPEALELEVEEAVEAEEAEAEPETLAVEVPQDGRAWYVIHCYSGYEAKVRHNLEQRIETMQMQDQIFQVVVPTEDEIEVRDGKRRVVERRVFPGYILVQMLLSDDSWYVVRNTPGVTGFVGMGNDPTPLRTEEVQSIMKRMEAEAPKIKVTFKHGQKVRIIDGPFNEFIGVVDEIDMERAKVRVLVSFFGRETPVELDFLQVEKT
jgi:transcriptional antiterminator NusG